MTDKTQQRLNELESVIVRKQDMLFRFAYMRVGSRADAEDIVQDVFLKLFRSSENLKSVRYVKHYLIRSISNACKDFHRRKQDILPLEKAEREMVSDDDLKMYEEYLRITALARTLPVSDVDTIRQLQLTNLNDFPIVPFLSISFTHHITILTKAKEWDERLFYIQYACDRKLNADELESTIKKDLYHHQGEMPNNFLSTIPDYKQAYRAIQMFKDEYMLDFINVEELGMRDEDIDERVIEQGIVHNIKNFIMTFGKGFTFNGSQVHYDKLGHDHWIDLLFYNRDLRRLVVFELKKGKFKTAYLGQLSSYLRILNDDDRREGEEPPIGIILCKSADKAYVEYIMQDFRQPMGVATYKTSDEMDAKLLEVLPSKEQLEKLLGD